ncbi:MAG: 6-bladed beta-propeller [Rikenellaceae bacterium]|nr:6-bladed beta-propeller [Rikenellaceae bacterium]
MKKIVLFLLFVPLFFSCGGGPSETSYVNEENTLVVSVPRPDYVNQHFFDAEKYADSVKFVRLETTDDNLISNVSELLFAEESIIVVDYPTASILFFDYNGHYLRKIQRRGRGPGEYLELSRVMLDADDNLIVYDAELRAMLYYDSEGKFLSITEDFCDGMLARDIINLPSGDFLCYRQDDLNREPESKREFRAGLWVAKKDGAFDRFIYPFDFEYKSNFVQYNYHLSQLPDGVVSFVDQNQTAVFYIEDDVVYKRVQFELPGKTEADFAGQEKQLEGYFAIFTNQEKGDYLFTRWIDDNNRSFHTILTKSTGELETGMTFNLMAFGEFLPAGSFVRNNNPHILSTWFYPYAVEEFVQGNFPEEFTSKAQALIEGIPADQIENANPILQLLYIKK